MACMRHQVGGILATDAIGMHQRRYASRAASRPRVTTPGAAAIAARRVLSTPAKRVAVVVEAKPDTVEAARARLDAIREEDELPVEDPGERGGFDMFSGGTYLPEVLAIWESSNAFFFPRVILVGCTALGLAGSLPQSIGGLFRGDEDGVVVLLQNLLFFAISAGFTAVDVKQRRQALDRLQRELALGGMQVIQRDKFRNERVFPLESLRQAARVAVVYGDADKVARDLAAATPFRRRLEQSRILVVPVVERRAARDGEERSAVADVGPGRWELLKDVVLAWPGAGAGRWLAWPTRNDAWAGYFARLLADAGADAERGGYVTLGVTGQVRGSGVGSPTWDVLLSTFPRNRPGNKADAEAEKAWKSATVDSTVGDLGAVLDGWGTVLRPDRRPEGLKLSDVDVTVERDQATVTVLETVANGATLLATQSFEKVDGDWVLKSHYTIPYGKDTVAKIALRCDERGCVAVPSKAVASQ